MEYLPSQPPQPSPSGAAKYVGQVAEGYDAKREQSPKWQLEQRIIEVMLSDLGAGASVLDCPVGTGRFLKFYAGKGLEFIGADISGDMLVQSALKLVPENHVAAWVAACNKANQIMPFRVPGKGVLTIGDIRQIGLPDKSVDAAVACRITRWLSPDDCQKMFRELQRVCRKRIIWTARVANHVHARSIDLFESALAPGWKIIRNEAGVDMDYRVIMAEFA
jgi:Methylase involved in ubiquinone/menaquinone biosynthesis